MGTHTSPLTNPAPSVPSKHLPGKPSDTGIPSASGAYNGTGIATLGPGGVDNNYHLFYQHYDGRIKHLTSTDPRTANWVESPDSSTMPSNARNRTPLSSVVALDGIHLFYISVSHQLQEIQRSNNSQNWENGPLNSGLVPVSNSLGVSLYATSYTGAYTSHLGTSAYYVAYYVLSLYYGSKDGSIHLLSSDFNGTNWNDTYTFAGSSGTNGVAVGPSFGDYDGTFVATIEDSTSQIQVWIDSPDLGWIQGKSS